MASIPGQILFVVGMHRSGTSALCGALQACGASFGEHLLPVIPGVNDEGFWEDQEVVEINDRLLSESGATWYAPRRFLAEGGALADLPETLQQDILAVLRRGFGSAPLQVVKDPRLCLTLPIWLQACEALGQRAQVCLAGRAPLEVADSLQRRDAFPHAYGLWLDLAYREAVARWSTPGMPRVSYGELLAQPQATLERLAATLPLEVDAEALSRAVRRDLRHCTADAADGEQGGGPLLQPLYGEAHARELREALEREYPLGAVTEELAQVLVDRGQELTRVGEAHSQALETIATKDRDIESLAEQYRHAVATVEAREEHLKRALATIDERDGQIREFDRRLAEIGAMHSHALEVIADKDRQINEFKERIDRLCNLPVIGLAFRMAKQHARR
jgi:hypothetical protein